MEIVEDMEIMPMMKLIGLKVSVNIRLNVRLVFDKAIK